MKIQVLKENLTKVVQMAAKFSSNKTQLPILSHLAIEATDEGIFVTSTSLDVGIRIRMSGKIIQAGKVVVPARILSELVQSLPLGGVDLEISEAQELLIRAQKTRAKLQGMNFEEFPPFPQLPELTGSLQVDNLMQTYSQVGFCVSTDESRPILTGFLWQGEKGLAVATDGYRLSISSQKSVWKVEQKGFSSLIVPGKAIVQLFQAFGDFDNKVVKFGYSEKSQELMFVGDDIWGVVRVLGGEFPKYDGILPTHSTIEVHASREQLLTAVKSVAIFARDSANIIKISIKDELLEFSANTSQVGENIVEVDVEAVQSGTGVIAFNGKYLIDFLTHSASEKIGFGMTDSLKPGLFYEVGIEEYKHVIMPVRIKV